MKRTAQGFTLIELLIVIAVLGILAVAVLSAINPIEQINRSRDTGSRSDAEQLLGAIDRYYASMGYYPWRSGPDAGSNAQSFLKLALYGTWIDDKSAVVLDKLSSSVTTGGTQELKSSFTSRITSVGYNSLFVYNQGNSGDSTYICFNGVSGSFQTEAKDRCNATKGDIPTDLLPIKPNLCGATVTGRSGAQYFTCLP